MKGCITKSFAAFRVPASVVKNAVWLFCTCFLCPQGKSIANGTESITACTAAEWGFILKKMKLIYPGT